MQLFFKEHFQPIVFRKFKDFKLEMLYERRYLSFRPPPKISLKHDHNWTKGNDQSGSTVEQRPVGKLVQQSFGEAPRAEFSKPTQQEVDGKRLQEELGSSDRTGQPVMSEDNRVMHAHDRTGELVKSSANTHSGRIWFCRTS